MTKPTIQIRSFVKGGNHGQYLQALGLRHVLMELLPNAKISHLNYNNHIPKEIYIQARGGYLPKYLAMRYFWKKRFDFSSFDNKSDLIIYGSDMIWHLESPLFPPDPIFFGFRGEGEKIAYAPSVADRGPNEPDWIKELLNDFKWIGVRDKNTANLVKDHTGKECPCMIDPCFFLLGSGYFPDFRTKSRENLLTVYSTSPTLDLRYFLDNFKRNKFSLFFDEIEYLGYFPRKRLLYKIKKQFQDPLTILHTISRSKLLLTSTFHGVMMALMTNTPFIAIRSPNLDARLDSPINKVFHKSRLIYQEQLKKLSLHDINGYLKNDIAQNLLQNYLLFSKNKLKAEISKILD